MQSRPVGTFLAVCVLLASVALTSGAADPPPAPATSQPQVLSFKALSTPSDGSQPVVSGAVGRVSILVVSNRRIKRFDKAGNPVGLDMDLDAFFGFPAGSGFIRLPQVQYDRIAQVFWIAAASNSYPSTIYIAFGGEPPNAFTIVHFTQDQAPPAGDAGGRVIDALSLGVDRQALYIGAVLQPGTGFPRSVSSAFVLPKNGLFNPSGPFVTAFRDLTFCDVASYQGCPGLWAPVGVNNDDPMSSEGYFIGTSYGNRNVLLMRRVIGPGSSGPTLSAEMPIDIATIGFPWSVRHLGFDQPLADFAAPALTSAVVHKDKMTGEVSLLTTLVDLPFLSNPLQTMGVWYRIGGLTGPAPDVVEDGVLQDLSATSPDSFLNPSAAMSGQGHIAIGATSAAVDEYLNAVTAGRYPTGPHDSFDWITATASANAYTPVQVDPSNHPWTHSSSTVVDPRDDMTMWTFQPWCDADDSVGLQVVKLAAPPPPVPDHADRYCPGGNFDGLPTFVSATSAPPAGFFDPGNDAGGPGYPNRFNVSISGGVGLLAPPVLYGPNDFSLEIDPATAMIPGHRSITVTNPDGQSVTSTNLLNVLALVPHPILRNSGPVCEGGTAQLFLAPAPGTPPGAQTYFWWAGGATLPTPVSDLQNPILTGVTLSQAGLYDGRIMVAGDTCGPGPTYTDLQVLPEGTQGCCPGATAPTGCYQGRCMPDFDGDGRGDYCDSCPTVPGYDFTDGDGDGIGDLCDNCPATSNPGAGPLNENFELSAAGFTPRNLGGFFSTTSWEWTNTRCGGTYPSKGWRTLGAAAPSCAPFGSTQEDSVLVSPLIILPIGSSKLAFDAIGYDQGGACLSSGEQDAKEAVLFPYPDELPDFYTTISGCARLTQGTGVVSHHEFDLSLFSGQTVRIGFRYKSATFFSSSQGWMVDNVVIKGALQTDDADGDGRGGVCDCAPANTSTWGAVDEVLNLQLASGAGGSVALSWNPPAGSHGVTGSVAYDVIRSTSSSDFVGPGVCIETNDASDTVASDSTTPPVGQAFYYVVRPENACGLGIAWRDSTGAVRPARTCP